MNAKLKDLKFPETIAVYRREMPRFKYNVIDSGVVEIKCPFRAEHMTITEALKKHADLRNFYDKGQLNMNVKHKFYFQIQGQLITTERLYCIFVMWSAKDFKVIIVLRDDKFWKNFMKPKITRFFFECMLPEIIDSQYNRNLPIREAEYIVNAQKSAQSTNAKKLNSAQNRVIENVLTSDSHADYLDEEKVATSKKVAKKMLFNTDDDDDQYDVSDYEKVVENLLASKTHDECFNQEQLESVKKFAKLFDNVDDEEEIIHMAGIETMANASTTNNGPPTDAERERFESMQANVSLDRITKIVLGGDMLDDECLDFFIHVLKINPPLTYKAHLLSCIPNT